MAIVSYEDVRRRRIEENNQVMESLGLLDLSKSLQPMKKKKKLTTQKNPIDPIEVWRSLRLAGMPVMSYKDHELTPLMKLQVAQDKKIPAQHMTAVNQGEKVYKNIKNPTYMRLMSYQDIARSSLYHMDPLTGFGLKKVQGRPRHIFEPSHLCEVEKICPHCDSTKNEFQYFNNNSVLQPRYKCLTCTHMNKL